MALETVFFVKLNDKGLDQFSNSYSYQWAVDSAGFEVVSRWDGNMGEYFVPVKIDLQGHFYEDELDFMLQFEKDIDWE